MDELLSIGEFSDRCGLSPKMLRDYASAGVLSPAAVDSASGYRYYAPGQLRTARVIALLRRAGVPVAQLPTFLRHPSGEELDRWERDLDAEMRVRRGALREVRELLGVERYEEPEDRTQVGTAPAEGGTAMSFTAMSGATDVGRVRVSNQDAVLTEGSILAVADGMGGHAAGEVAAHVAVETLRSAGSDAVTLSTLTEAVRAANHAIWERSQADAALTGMGTTVCAAAIVGVGGDEDGQRLALANVGDSRAYLFRGGELQQLTLDHSVVAELLRLGEIDEAEARGHPHRNVLTRALGMGPDVDVDTRLVAVEPGDRLLLCTDGLTNEVDEAGIVSALATAPDAEQASQVLVRRALEAGGADNVSVIVVDVGGAR